MVNNLNLLYTNRQSSPFHVFYWWRAYHVRLTKLDYASVNNDVFYASVNNDVPTFDITKLPTFLPAPEPPPNLEPHEVCKKLLLIKAFKSSGPDNIRSRILREFAYELAEPITRIFNISIAS